MASKVQRGAVPVPNNMKGNHANSCGPMTRGAPATKAPNAKIHDGATKNGFLPLSKKAGVIAEPNAKNKFNVENARCGYDDTEVLAPGRGEVPVNPFQDRTGNPNMINIPLRDSAKKGK